MAEEAELNPDRLAQSTRDTLKRLSAEARRLKKLSEIRSLRENPREVSINVDDLLSDNRTGQAGPA